MFGLTPSRRNNDACCRSNANDLRSIFDSFFNDSFFPSVFGQDFGALGHFTGMHPIKADIRETGKEYIVDAEIPGASKEDIKLEFKNDTLTISVEQNQQVNEEKENYIRRERRYGSFSRSFYVENVKQDEVAAKYENGILTITMPKKNEEKNDGKRIDIN